MYDGPTIGAMMSTRLTNLAGGLHVFMLDRTWNACLFGDRGYAAPAIMGAGDIES